MLKVYSTRSGISNVAMKISNVTMKLFRDSGRCNTSIPARQRLSDPGHKVELDKRID